MNSDLLVPTHSRNAQNLLKVLNLRSGEEQRTLLMFAFNTLMSMGILWLEVSSAALFLEEYGADKLPYIYVFSAVVGFGLSFIYSWMQRFVPLRRVIVVIALVMTLPMLGFRWGLSTAWAPITVFGMRLWMEAITNINELNVSVAANQLFNIREIKRTFPLVSGGNLVADVVSGFTLYFLLGPLGINNILYLTFAIMVMATGVLFYISKIYRHAFPDSLKRRNTERGQSFAAQKVQKSITKYLLLLFGVFALSQILLFLIEYQYLDQLTGQNFSVDMMAKFLGIFTGVLGLTELITQVFTASRLIEKFGVFVTTGLLPVVTTLFAGVCLVVSSPMIQGSVGLFWGLVALKFLDEWLRYTVIAGSRPVLFQPIPDQARAKVQSWVAIAEALAIGLTGIGIAVVIAVSNHYGLVDMSDRARMFLIITLALAAMWLVVIYGLRKQYLELLVTSAERGLFSFTDKDLGALRQGLRETFQASNTNEAEKRVCIELLTSIDPQNIASMLAPELGQMSLSLKRKSLETMLEHQPRPDLEALNDFVSGDLDADAFDSASAEMNLGFQVQSDDQTAVITDVESLINPAQSPDVLALALRYVGYHKFNFDLETLQPYLSRDTHPMVRSVAAAMMLRPGSTPQQRSQAITILRQMLTHADERERMMGCLALSEAQYIQVLRLEVPNLLKDDSLRVRRALLSAIASTKLTEYYPALLQGLRYHSTRQAANQALVKLGDDALPMLITLAENVYQPDVVRHQAWLAMGDISTPDALNLLVANLTTSWGRTRRWILKILLKLVEDESTRQGLYINTDSRMSNRLPNWRDRNKDDRKRQSKKSNLSFYIDTIIETRLGRKDIEPLIHQELTFLGQMYASLIDFSTLALTNPNLELLTRSLRDSQSDSIERLFLLLRFLYPSAVIQAAAICMEGFSTSRARGLEILDQTLNLPAKRAILSVLDTRSDSEKLNTLADFVSYHPLSPQQRLVTLVDLRHFLSDWSLACCFHLARIERWKLTSNQVVACLRHPVGFVREAVLSYVEVMSPRFLHEILPVMQQDPNPLVQRQAESIVMKQSLKH
jgi:HEAT repeat protein